MNKSRNEELLKSFRLYCEAHPNERFWQALRNWAGMRKIVAVENNSPCGCGTHDSIDDENHDTFYWEGKNG